MMLRLMAISVMWVNVQVAMPATVHSSNTADSASPQRNTSSRSSSWGVDNTRILEWSWSMAARRWPPPVGGNARATSTRAASELDTMALSGTWVASESKGDVHQRNSDR